MAGTLFRFFSPSPRRVLVLVAGLALLSSVLAPAAAAGRLIAELPQSKPLLVERTSTPPRGTHAPLAAIVSFHASALKLPYRGSAVTLTVRVQNARRCMFYGQKTTASSLYPLRNVPCSSGSASVRMPAIPNHTVRPAALWYQVRVRGASARTVRRTLIVNENAAPTAPTSAPSPRTPSTIPTATLTLSTSTIPSAGGHVDLTLESTGADTCSLSAGPGSLWTEANPRSVDCNGRYGVDVAASTTTRQWTITFTATNSTGQTTSSAQTLTQTAASPGAGAGGLATSSNWSGYVLQASTTVTEVGGNWTVPQLNCAVTPNAGVGIWVGIGGVDGSTLLQTGTVSECVNGVQLDVGWTEEYPSDPNHSDNFTSFPVTAGNAIQANVFQDSSGQWETRVDNLSTALSGVLVTGVGWGIAQDGASTFTQQGSAVGLSYPGATTAEWIAEAFESDGSQVQCADFGTLTFTNLTTSLGSWPLAQAQGVELVQNGAATAIPSPPSDTGFTVSYTAS